MAAPALVMLAEGSTDPRVTHVAHALRVALQGQRPELSVNTAFLDHCPPTGPQVVSQLIARGAQEIVLVPLGLVRFFLGRFLGLEAEVDRSLAGLDDGMHAAPLATLAFWGWRNRRG